MGFLRFLLALSVIVTHSSPIFGITLLPGNLAVESFFMISGFYMALVLEEKYFKINKYYKLFISNRFLRIYPLYWVMILIIITFYLSEGIRMGNYHYLQLYADYCKKLNPFTLIYLITTNIFIVGQEYAIFFTINDQGNLTYNLHTLISKTPLIKFMLDIPIWTVSLEFMFYFISPIMVKLKHNWLITITLILLIARLISKLYGLPYEPFLYRLFPYQLMFFLLGIVGYRMYNHLEPLKISNYIYYLMISYIILFTVFYDGFIDSEIKDGIYLTSFFVIMPFAFNFLKANKLDRYIGELSFPMYVSHAFFLDISLRLTNRYHLNNSFFPIFGCCFSIIFSILLVKFVSKKIETCRSQRLKFL